MNTFHELKRRNVFKVAVMYMIVGWLVIQIASTLTPVLMLPEWTTRLVISLLIVGFPVALLFAWAFELTPDGVKRTKDVDLDDSITHVTGKRLEYSIIVLLLFVVGFLYFKPAQPPDLVASASDARPSIAVLPFEDFSPEKNQEYFSKGISEEILNLLAKTDDLKVAARTSSFAFHNSEEDIRHIGQKLDVKTVLEGSIRKSGQTLRITAQLINVDDGYHLWSETYDRDMSDIFAIQDEIAAAILDNLKIKLLGEASRQAAIQTTNTDAYNGYLIARERMSNQTATDMDDAIGILTNVLKEDPNFAPAHVQIVLASLQKEYLTSGNLNPQERQALRDQTDELASYHLRRAKELLPELPELHGVSGYYALRRNDFDAAEISLDYALKLNANYARAYTWRATVRYQQHNYTAMLADREKAYQLDPMSLDISARLAYDYRSFWRPDDANKIIDRMFELHPHHASAYRAKAANFSAYGKYSQSVTTLLEAKKYNPDETWMNRWLTFDLSALGEDAYLNQITPDDAAIMQGYKNGWTETSVNALMKKLSGKERQDYLWAARDYFRMIEDKDNLVQIIDETIAFYKEHNTSWDQDCDSYLIESIQYTGMDIDLTPALQTCRSQTEERIKAKYLCPCSWYSLVSFAIIDGRDRDAVKRAYEWLDYGDYYYALDKDPVFAHLKGQPEYQDLLQRNRDRMAEERRTFLRYRANLEGFPPLKASN